MAIRSLADAAEEGMRFRFVWIGLVALMATGAIGCGAGWMRFDQSTSPPPLPVYGQIPDFRLTERSGQSVALSDLQGKIWVADFIFTRCPGPCPLMTARMASMQQGVATAADVRLVSFSVDPEYDTPAVLREYADKYGAGASWLFITGEKAAIFKLSVDGFHLAAQDNPDAATMPEQGPVIHSTKFVLVDPQAQIRGYYDSTDPESVRQLLRDVETVRREKIRHKTQDTRRKTSSGNGEIGKPGNSATLILLCSRFPVSPSLLNLGSWVLGLGSSLSLLSLESWVLGLGSSLLPTVNATLNATSAFLLVLGYMFIRRRNVAAHRVCMVSAFVTSTLFLVSYLTYHYYHGSQHFHGQGWIRTVYFTVLTSHTILAAVIVPLVLVTLVRALRERFDQHRKIARWTLPIWMYVSVTGVIIYWMLYRRDDLNLWAR